jgi:hypothetical protein
LKFQKVLFVYTAESATGLSAKAEKIARGFVDAGCDLDTIYLGSGDKRLSRLKDIVSVYIQFVIRAVNGHYDLVYMRYAYYFAPIYFFTYFLKADLQVDINSNVTNELRSRGQKIRIILDWLSMYIVRRRAKKIHVVSKSLTEEFQIQYPDTNFVFTANFVVDEHKSTKNRVKEGKINLLFMGNTAQKWHGIPLFIEKLLANNEWFKSVCHLHFIGLVDHDTQHAVEKYGLQNNVTVHGLLFGEKKHAVLSEMDIGLSSFDLMFKGMKETTAIKTGEYLYNGIGLLIGYEDPVIPSALPFVQSVDLSGDVRREREKFRAFVCGYRNITEVEQQAHQFAKNHLLVDRYISNILDDKVALRL